MYFIVTVMRFVIVLNKVLCMYVYVCMYVYHRLRGSAALL